MFQKTLKLQTTIIRIEMSLVFFRNDDVRDSLDKSLIDLTSIFIGEDVPINHVVEPANVSPEVVAWIKEKKKEWPKLIEIGQHGFDHKLKAVKKILGKIRKGEFGYGRKL